MMLFEEEMILYLNKSIILNEEFSIMAIHIEDHHQLYGRMK